MKDSFLGACLLADPMTCSPFSIDVLDLPVASDVEPPRAGLVTLHQLVAPVFSQGLANLSGQLAKAAIHAEVKGIDLQDLLSARLAADMHPLAAQIGFVCLQARECVARLLGRPLPVQPSINTPLQARDAIDLALSDVWEADRSALDQGSDRPLQLRLADGAALRLTGREYVRDWAIPQFYFHLVCAYAILRNQGVPLGKGDYVPLTMSGLDEDR